MHRTEQIDLERQKHREWLARHNSKHQMIRQARPGNRVSRKIRKKHK